MMSGPSCLAPSVSLVGAVKLCASNFFCGKVGFNSFLLEENSDVSPRRPLTFESYCCLCCHLVRR